MEYKWYNLMFDKDQNQEELNKIMRVIVDKQEMLIDNNEKTNNAQLGGKYINQ